MRRGEEGKIRSLLWSGFHYNKEESILIYLRESPVNTQRPVHEFKVFQIIAESSDVLQRKGVPGQDVNILAP